MKLLKKVLLTVILSGGSLAFAQKSEINLADSTGMPGDNFSLEGALGLFKESKSPEDFEKKLNSKNETVNNLDLNGDGKTDYVRVVADTKEGAHVFILQTPLFRVRNKKETIYCYSEPERANAVQKLGPKPEITRFRGLGEISPDEFSNFIGKDMRLEPVTLGQEETIHNLLGYYMGKNSEERQKFIIERLKRRVANKI